MRIGYLDCFSGVAGDMWVGALLDLGVPFEALQAAVQSLRLEGVRIQREAVLRAGIAATRFVVQVDGREPGAAPEPTPGDHHHHPHAHDHGHDHAHDHAHDHPHGEAHAHVHAHGDAPVQAGRPHRHLADIRAILHRADLPDVVRQQCDAVFAAIAEAEARQHGCSVDTVHFHEVGAEDTIVDIVCACLGTHLLGIDRLYSSAVAVGSGTVRCEHGLLPVPAPGTLDLLFGMPVRHGGLCGERTTPTGAALLRVLVAEFEPQFHWVPGARGHGAGRRDDDGHANVLRLTVGEQRDAHSATAVQELSCQLDTATGETLAWLLDELLRRGALDAFATPIVMKKGRPAQQLTALCDDAHADALQTFLLEESSSLGVRRRRLERAVLERWQESRATALGPVAYKVARLPSGALLARPEDDELRRLCAAHGLSRSEVLRRLLAE